MHNRFLIITFILVIFSGFAIAKSQHTQNALPVEQPQINNPSKPETLRDQMDKMIISVADLDIMVNKNKELDYEILQEDAERILDALKHISRLDKNGRFKKHVAHVKEPTQNLLKYAKQKDSRAGDYPEQIFNACFKCHAENRSPNFLKAKTIP